TYAPTGKLRKPEKYQNLQRTEFASPGRKSPETNRHHEDPATSASQPLPSLDNPQPSQAPAYPSGEMPDAEALRYRADTVGDAVETANVGSSHVLYQSQVIPTSRRSKHHSSSVTD